MSQDLLTLPEVSIAADTLRPRESSDAAMRWFELGLVLLTAFGNAILSSIYTLKFGPIKSGMPTGYRWLWMAVTEISGLLLLGYVLNRRRMRIRDLGLSWGWGEAGRGALLAVASYALYYLSYPLLFRIQHLVFRGVGGGETARQAFGHATLLMAAFSLLNPFFEELIVRVFLITEVRALTGSSTLAVILSVALQTSYHLYYGWVGALALGSGFLIYSLYYARTRRATPIVVAHGIWDLLALLWLR